MRCQASNTLLELSRHLISTRLDEGFKTTNDECQRMFVIGQPKDTNLDTYTMLRMGNVPEVDIEFMPSTEAPVGLGEPATAVIAPAIANAIFAATGARLRHLPIRPQDVRQALAHRT
jgi:CO/xanthine dehydrogenase Mo-binding subunit